MLIVPDYSARILLNRLLQNALTWVHLYTNPAPLGPTTVRDELQEAAFAGYSPQQIKTWSDAVTVVGRAVSFADPVWWAYGVNPGDTLIYGYWISWDKNGPIYWVESVPGGPILLHKSDDPIQVYPRLTLRGDSEPEPTLIIGPPVPYPELIKGKPA